VADGAELSQLSSIMPLSFVQLLLQLHSRPRQRLDSCDLFKDLIRMFLQTSQRDLLELRWHFVYGFVCIQFKLF